jgi:hypothetical protein
MGGGFFARRAFTLCGDGFRPSASTSKNDGMTRLPTLLDDLEGRPSLAQPERVHERLEALEALERCLTLVDTAGDPLHMRASALVARLEAINQVLYQSIRDDIRRGRGAASLLELAAGVSQPRGDGYDALDELVSGVLEFDPPDASTMTLSDDMVFYQPTPARHAFAMLARTGLDSSDVLVDLGSGLGHVPLLAGICTDARAIGVELEPAYVACARQAAAELALSRVEFLQQDARIADLSSGTVFYLYTPFRGAIMRDVLDRLREEASRRAIRICTFGPCTPVVAREPWLSGSDALHTDRITVFHATR